MTGSPTRRDLLRAGGAGIAVGAGVASAGCLGLGGSTAVGTGWTPSAGSWPLARYDPRNSGHNPHAAVPTGAPETAWALDTPITAGGLVVGEGALDRFVVAYGEQGLVVLRDSDRHRLRQEFVPATAVGFGPSPAGATVDGPGEGGTEPIGPTLYAAGQIGRREGTSVQALRGWTVGFDELSQTQWGTYDLEGGRDPWHLVTGPDAVHVGHWGGAERSLLSFEVDSGAVRWRTAGRFPALIGGADGLVASDRSRLYRYGERSGIDAVLHDDPAEVWRGTGVYQTPPAVVDGRVVVGGGSTPLTDERTLFAQDVETGELLWEPVGGSGRPTAPAVAGDGAYLTTYTYDDFGSYSLPNGGVVRAVDLTDGSVAWSDTVSWVPAAAVVDGAGTVVVAGGFPSGAAYPEGSVPGEGGRVHAYDAASGERLWALETVERLSAAALVGETVYVGGTGGRIEALGTG